MVGVLLASPFGRGGCDQREQTERAHPLPCGELPPQRLRGLSIGEAKKMRLAKRLAFFRFDFSFGIIKGEQPLIRGSSASKSLVVFWFSFAIKREQSPPGCSASKSLRPCRAEHAAFASQTGLRLKSPTGAFMPSGHRRPFWFSFAIKREQSPPGCSASKSLRPCRAKHAAFASQTGPRLKSPAGAFMPSGHRRPFWFSFGAKREHIWRRSIL